MKTKRKIFTIIELLIVIAIIGVLMALLFPTFHIVRKKAKMAKAQSQVNAIVMAIKNYETTYGLLPWTAGADTEWDDLTTGTADANAYDILMQILTKVNQTAGTGAAATSKANQGNLRSIKFLDVATNFATAGFLDPWDKRYAISMDLDYDGDATVGSSTLNGTVFVYSFGSDGQDDEGASSGIQGNDDVSSWSSQ